MMKTYVSINSLGVVASSPRSAANSSRKKGFEGVGGRGRAMVDVADSRLEASGRVIGVRSINCFETLYLVRDCTYLGLKN